MRLATIKLLVDFMEFQFKWTLSIMSYGGWVYILTNKNKTTLYVGVTSDLLNRIYKHKNKIYPNSFSARYNLDTLVYFNGFNRIEEAIENERLIKAGNRKAKIKLINSRNPDWKDLYEEVLRW